MDFDIIKWLNLKMPKHTKMCLISGVIAGWLTHFYMFTHKLPNWDDLNNIGAYGSGDYLGRWFLKYIHNLGGQYSIPAVHGVLFILCLSIAACFVLEIAQIKSMTGAILVPIVMVTFPSVISTMTFMFMAHTSGIGILMVCVAIYLLRKYKHGWIPCIIMLVCVLGIYQSYVSIAIALMLIGMIVDLLKGKPAWDTVKHGLLCVAILGVSVVAYMGLSHIIYPNLDNETYGGVGNMGQIAISEMPTLIGRCYKRFLEYFLWKPFAFVTKTSQRMNQLVCALAIVIFPYLVWKKQLYKKLFEVALCVILCGFMPLAVAFIYFMAPDVDYSMLMLYAYTLIYVLVLAMLEVCMQEWSYEEKLVPWQKYARFGLVVVAAGVIFVSCYTDYLITNKAYMRMDLACQRVNNYFNRILTSVEAQEGYVNGDEVTFVGNFYYKENPSVVEFDFMDSESLRELSGVALENGLMTSGARDNFIRHYVGFNMADLSEGDKEQIAMTEEFKQMPDYPAEGSIKKIDDMWVVKLCK